MKASAGKLRILMLLENNPYPQDSRVRREAQALTQAGHRVSVIAQRGRNQPWQEVVDGVRVYRFPAPPDGNGFLGYLLEYGQALLSMLVLSLWALVREGFDVIHAHNPPDVMVLIAALYKPLGKRFVFDHHDLSPEMYYARFQGEGNRLVFQALAFFEKLSCRLADRIIATNRSYKAMEMARSGVPEERITIVRNGPDLERLQPVPPDPELRAKAPTILGYVGDMGFHDGLDYLLRALHRLRYDLGRTDFYAVLIGKGDAWEGLQGLRAELELEEHVWFTGRVSDEDLVRYLSTADICLDPDPKNPFTDRSTMIKMTEYMALSKPIVAFDLTEHRFTAQEAALYAQPNDELDFARKIAQLMDDPEARARMGAFGRRRIETELAWRYSVPKLLQAYETLARPQPQEKVALP